MNRPNTPRGEREFQRVPCRALIRGERMPFDAELVHFERPEESIHAISDGWKILWRSPEARWRLEARDVPWLAFANAFGGTGVSLLHVFFGTRPRPGVLRTGLAALSDLTVTRDNGSEASSYRLELDGHGLYRSFYAG